MSGGVPAEDNGLPTSACRHTAGAADLASPVGGWHCVSNVRGRPRRRQMVARRSRDGEGSLPWTGRTRPHKGGRAVLVDKVSPGPGNPAPTAVKSKCSTVGATCGRPRTGGPTERKFAGFGIMTWFPVWKIFGPVRLEKKVICDRSRCRGAHCASAPGRLRTGKWGLCKIVQTLSVCPKGRQLSQRESQIRRTCGADGGTGNPSPTMGNLPGSAS